jgi:hypothetical protein
VGGGKKYISTTPSPQFSVAVPLKKLRADLTIIHSWFMHTEDEREVLF